MLYVGRIAVEKNLEAFLHRDMPVAAFPVSAPVDVIEHGVSGWMDDDMGIAITRGFGLSRQAVIDHAARYSWGQAVRQFQSFLAQIEPHLLPAAHSSYGRHASR